MRFATYNLWNSTVDWERRLTAIADELKALGADVVALQEAPVEASPDNALAAYLQAEIGYPQVRFAAYDASPDPGDRPEGLMVLSRLLVGDVRTNWEGGLTTGNSFAMRIQVEVSGMSLGITNVHLDWERAEHRIEAMTKIVDRLIDPHPADIEILCGDFNEYDDGPVAAFLEGRWFDAAKNQAGDGAAPVTLDFKNNPRWQGTGNTERPGRFDRIYLRAVNRPMPRIIAAGLFGRQPANRFGIVPSDHYGVYVDLEL